MLDTITYVKVSGEHFELEDTIKCYNYTPWRYYLLHFEFITYAKLNIRIHPYRSDQFSLLMYLCLLPSSATVKMDNGESMNNSHYATNDDTAGFINRMKNRNTSRKSEYDMKLIKNYFASMKNPYYTPCNTAHIITPHVIRIRLLCKT
jgi:hypothetical protein